MARLASALNGLAGTQLRERGGEGFRHFGIAIAVLQHGGKLNLASHWGHPFLYAINADRELHEPLFFNGGNHLMDYTRGRDPFGNRPEGRGTRELPLSSAFHNEGKS